MKDPLVSDINEFVNDIYRQISPQVRNGDYAIYGHSLGGLITYLLTLKLMENNHKLPVHLFITGTTGPSAISRTEKKRHLLEKKEFFEEIRELNGMPEETYPPGEQIIVGLDRTAKEQLCQPGLTRPTPPRL